MILEPFTFMLNNNADGNLSHGWFNPPPNTTTAPHGAPSGGPSIRFEQGYALRPRYSSIYFLTGQLLASKSR